MFIFSREIASHEKISEEKMNELFNVDVFEKILEAIAGKKINESDVKSILEKIAKGSSVNEALRVEKIDLSEIEGEVAKIIAEKPGLSSGAYMGLVMAKFKGKVSGKDVSDIISKFIK
jgi:Glu-tRNA(Gln) amidotransferase subunit E-like FAD-binding protein